MSSSRTPPHKTVTRMPSLGPSFASCFGATVPVSPPRASGQALLAGQAGVHYRRLRFDDFVVDEDQCGYESGGGGTEYQNSEHLYSWHFRRGAATAKLGKHSSFKERASSRSSRSEVLYMSEGEQEIGRERKGGWRLGKQRGAAGISSGRYSLKKNNIMYDESEEGGHEYGNQTKKAAGMEVYIDDDDKSGKDRGGKKGSKREKAMKEGGMMMDAPRHVSEAGESSSPRRRASFGARMREACVQVLETARRGSPHLSELFVGNQLLMQVTAAASFNSRHAKRMAPSYGLHVSSYMVSSPAHSTSSAF